ncbi:MAG TPA: hypothetical protein VFE16_05450 [Candidatus Cybelea sp.]|jgi:hypothetical protein|nr:hypothetical protein [Candidatus Cybelea sp.]
MLWSKNGQDADLRVAFALGVATAILSGCGGTGIPTPGTITQSASVQHDRAGSWMLPEAKRQNLLYVTLPYEHSVNIYTFPGGHLVGQITDDNYPNTVCSDKMGNVWISSEVSNYYAQFNEYTHGGTTPIATLDDKSGNPSACSVDPLTGNLAVANGCCDSNHVVDIYVGATGTPQVYNPKDLFEINAITYDSTGDLFISGNISVYLTGTDWFRYGGPGFRTFRVKRPRTYPHEGIFWDGRYLTEVAQPYLIHRYAIVDRKAKYVGSLAFNGLRAWAFAIEKANLAVADEDSAYNGVIYVFKYPAGGEPTHTINLPEDAARIAISVARP